MLRLMIKAGWLLSFFLPLFAFGQQVSILNYDVDPGTLHVGKTNLVRIRSWEPDMQVSVEGCGSSYKKVNDSIISIAVNRSGYCRLTIHRAGRMLGAWQYRVKFLPGFLAQQIRSLRTDKDCQEFINRYLEDQQDFYFDTIFTAAQVSQLNLPYRNWGVFDFNNDRQPDLWFVGRYKGHYWHHARLYLSSNEEYNGSNLFRDGGGQYEPLIFSRKQSGKELLFVYLFDLHNYTKTDSLISLRKALYPAGIRWVDTLVYKFNDVVNFAQRPSRLDFDSVDFRCNWTQTCKDNWFTIYSDGRFIYRSAWCGRVQFERTLDVKPEKFEIFKSIVREIDLANTSTRYVLSATDQSTAQTTIYSGNRKISFYDYGMESSFTLMALYAFLLSIPRNSIE
jgi:hypothetical protein